MRGYARKLATTLVLTGLVAGAGTGCADGTGPSDPPGPFGTDTAPDISALLGGLDMEAGVAGITAADMTDRIGVLAHDSMQGRLTGTPELEAAAGWIAGELAAAGLEPLGSSPGATGTEAYLARWDLPPAFTTEWDDSLASHPPNVVAVLPGSDPALTREYVVVTAHFDHVGTGPADSTGDGIFNGADDNASGTAALLEVAEALGSLPAAPRRSVLFLAVSGEELGLLGSELYLVEPTVSLADMVANINLDMVSRGPATGVWVVGFGLSSLGLWAQAVTDQVPAVGILALSDQYLGADLMNRSDHFPFAASRIPAIGLFGGFHPDYHTPDDEVERINPEKAAAVARVAAYLVATAAMLDDPPEWTSLGRAVMTRWW